MGGVGGRREYPHASYPIKLAAMNWGEGITVDARRASVSPAMPCTEKTRELVELINEAARLEGFEAGWVDAGGGSDANRIAQAGPPPSLTVLPLPVAASAPNANTSASTRSKTACACSRASCPFSKKNRSKQVKG